MISRKSFVLAALLAFSCCLKGAHAQLPPLPPDNTPLFGVDFDQDIVPAAQQPLYQQMANILTGFTGIPNDRSTYFSAVINNNGCTVRCWNGIITNVQANCNGHLVTVQVIPSLSSDVYGPAACAVTFDYSEQYQVNNDGTFQYLGSVFTQALAGQMPYLIGFGPTTTAEITRRRLVFLREKKTSRLRFSMEKEARRVPVVGVLISGRATICQEHPTVASSR